MGGHRDGANRDKNVGWTLIYILGSKKHCTTLYSVVFYMPPYKIAILRFPENAFSPTPSNGRMKPIRIVSKIILSAPCKVSYEKERTREGPKGGLHIYEERMNKLWSATLNYTFHQKH